MALTLGTSVARSVALGVCLLGFPAAISAAEPPVPIASYVVELLSTAPPRMAVRATLPSDGVRLSMSDSRPADVPEVADAGWPGLVRNLTVTDSEGRAVAWTSVDASGWTLERPISGSIWLRYEIDYAPLALRGWPAPREAAFSDSGRFVAIGRSLFITTPVQRPSEVRFTLPLGWQLAAPWPQLPGAAHGSAVATSHDLTENLMAFVDGKPEVVTAGGFDLNVVAFGHWAPARREVSRTLRAALRQFVSRFESKHRAAYLVVLLPHAENGGESFRASFALSSEEAPSAGNLGHWGNLIAHEIFHHWNGWLLRGSDYASSQWFQEGFTEYAANHALVSARLIPPEEFLGKLAKHVSNYRQLGTPLDAPGTRKGRPLYSGGALAAFIWDVVIRDTTRSRRGVHHVLRALLRATEGGSRAYEWKDIQAAAEGVSPGDWAGFHHRFIHGTEPLPLAETFARVGLSMSESSNGEVQIEMDPAASPKARALRREVIEGRR